ASSAIAGRIAVGFVTDAATTSAAASAGRLRSRARTPPTVRTSATRSGFTAGPQIATGDSASQPKPSAAATSEPPADARHATSAAMPTVARTLSARPVTNGSPTDASRKYSGG